MQQTTPLKLKVCGMRQPENIRELLEKVRPDYMGMIFFEKSSRHAPTELHAENLPTFPPTLIPTGVFVGTTFEEIMERVRTYSLKAVQLHGNEPPELAKKLQTAGLSVLKVFGVKDSFDFAALAPFEPYVDYFLFDTKGEKHGGNGYPFNWEILNDYPSNVPFFLSGGIAAESVAALQQFKHPQFAGIDINSRFETEPGKKDIEQIARFWQVLQESPRATF